MNDLLSPSDTEAVFQILVNELGVTRAQITSDVRLEEDLGADSLDLVEINMALEDYFQVPVPDEAAEKIKTVGDLFEALAELLKLPKL